MDIEFDFKGDPVGGVISTCKLPCKQLQIHVLLFVISDLLEKVSWKVFNLIILSLTLVSRCLPKL